MFFYLSFLRPLPNTASPGEATVSITPQIANDLRTAYLESPVDIFYAWAPCHNLSRLGSSSTLSIAGSPRKLTTWRTSAMYKNLTIPLPSGAKPGEEWQLMLSCGPSRPNSNAIAIDLGTPLGAFGELPLPVLSMPLRIEARKQGGGKAGKAGKQERIERMYSIPGLAPRISSSMLCIREQTSFDLDKKIWDSGLGLSAWLTKLALSDRESENALIRKVKRSLSPISTHGGGDGLRIVELGTGTGIVSICLSTLLHNINSRTKIEVYATDLPSAIELITHNISSNKPAYPSIALSPLVLDWDAENLPPEVAGRIEVITMADVTYNTASFPSLVLTIQHLIRSSKLASSASPSPTNSPTALPTSEPMFITSPSTATPLIILAYKQRDPAERDLWEMLRAAGVELEKVDHVQGAGGGEVEIWVGGGEQGESEA